MEKENPVQTQNIQMEVENPDIFFSFYLPQSLDDQLEDYAYNQSKLTRKRVSKADIIRISLMEFFKKNANQNNS